jgi:imidazolonepropionase-like amidohydrolase
MSARNRIIVCHAASLLAMAAMIAPGLARDQDNDRCAGSRDVTLVNGTIHTLDARNSIVSSVTIRNGKFAGVGREARSDDGSCMRTISLNGRTAVPGLIDNHNHFPVFGYLKA